MPSVRMLSVAGLGFLLASASSRWAAAAECHQSHDLGEAVQAAIRQKSEFHGDPGMYCLIERRQLKAAEAFRDYVANRPECFVDEAKRLHALELVQKTVETARADVAEDCK